MDERKVSLAARDDQWTSVTHGAYLEVARLEGGLGGRTPGDTRTTMLRYTMVTTDMSRTAER
jgi:hypothetical protein